MLAETDFPGKTLDDGAYVGVSMSQTRKRLVMRRDEDVSSDHGGR